MTPTSQAPRDTRILLVDDEPTLLKALARHLEYEGLEVVTAASRVLGSCDGARSGH